MSPTPESNHAYGLGFDEVYKSGGSKERCMLTSLFIDHRENVPFIVDLSIKTGYNARSHLLLQKYFKYLGVSAISSHLLAPFIALQLTF